MARRNELARARGFRSYREQRKFSATVSNRSALEKLPTAALEVRQAVTDVVVKARRSGLDIETVAAREGVPLEAVRWWARDAVVSRKGVLHPSPGDRMFRPMYVYSAGRIEPVDVRGNKVASRVSAYHSAIQHYVNTGDSSQLAKFTGTSVGGVELETDLDAIDELARRGSFTFESIYRMVEP